MTTPELPILAAKLRRLREHLGMSRPAFAELLGIPPTNYVHYLLNNSASVDTLGVLDKEAA